MSSLLVILSMVLGQSDPLQTESLPLVLAADLTGSMKTNSVSPLPLRLSLDDETYRQQKPANPDEPEPDMTFSVGVRAVEWAMFHARETIHNQVDSWKFRVHDAMGVGVCLNVRRGKWFFEKYFDYTFAVLSNTDNMVLRTLGFNVGWDISSCVMKRKNFEHVYLFGGPSITYINVTLEENGVDLPGKFSPSAGFQIGLRYFREEFELSEGGAKIGFSGEMAYRYAALRFSGEDGASSESIGGSGMVVAIGLYIKF